MLLKSKLLLLLCCLCSYPIYAQFKVEINSSNGAISKISNLKDPNQMNWIFSSSDGISDWQKPNQDWGLGKYQLNEPGATPQKWEHLSTKKTTRDTSSFLYQTKFLNVKVSRYQEKGYYVETYTFTNHTHRALAIKTLGIYTPFNDNYPDSRICATERCNAHIWTGMHATYVNALRMNGQGPHLGLVLTKGAIDCYAIENRSRANNSSNSRGTIVLNVAPFSLKPGESYTLQWKMFWHEGWDDFYKTAKKLGFVRLDADRYVISKNEKLRINIDAADYHGIKKKNIEVLGNNDGEHSYKVYFDKGKKYTLLNYLVISSAKELINKRAHFIVDHQQMNDATDNRYGAYMVYDNELGKIVTDATKTVSPFDRNEGAERLGMGVFIAKWLQSNKDDKVYQSLMRYAKFVRTKLQAKDYTVYSNVAHTSTHRGYNYPWVASFYLQVFKLTNQKEYLTDYYQTLRKFFKEFDHKFYGIDIRLKEGIDALANAGMYAERDSLMNDFKLSGEYFIQNGIFYPKHEVNYEQSIVAPAVTFLCELYLLTKDEKYLAAAKIQMPSLEAFNGKQPDVHLNEIAIRHWDGYWFGKEERFGDTMPQYWSALTAVAFNRYYQCTLDQRYQQRAIKIVENNLLNFKENGTASCAYIYPKMVNGELGKYYDPYANDQDWALVYFQEVTSSKL